MISPGLEPETFSVLDWRDNQLHHETVKCHDADILMKTSVSKYYYDAIELGQEERISGKQGTKPIKWKF